MSRFRGNSRGQLSISGIDHQSYDPELLAIEPGANVITQRRLGAGFGAPPVVPYGQRRAYGQSMKRQLLARFPNLRNFPTIKKILER